MKEIKKITEQIENEAYKNVEGFDFTRLCFRTVFEILNNGGVFIKLFDELFSGCVEDESQITLKTFKYGCVKENDLKIYPMVDLVISLIDADANVETNFCLSLTPFNASFNNLDKDTDIYGVRNKELTKIWRIILKGFLGEAWENALEKYSEKVKSLDGVNDDSVSVAENFIEHEQEGYV